MRLIRPHRNIKVALAAGSAVIIAVLSGAVMLPTAHASDLENAECYYDSDIDDVVCVAEDGTVIGGEDSDNPGGGGSGGERECVMANGDVIPCRDGNTVYSDVHHCYVGPVSDDMLELYEPTRPDGVSEDARPYNCYNPLVGIIGGTPMTTLWLEDAPPGLGGVDPRVLAEQMIDSMPLGAIGIQMSPPPLSLNSDSMGLVGLPVYLWTDESYWEDDAETATASAGSVEVSASARVETVTWDMGDGTVFSCDVPGTPYQISFGVTAESECGHVYDQASRSEPDQAYTVTATTDWLVEWTSNVGVGDTLTLEFSESEQLRIAEMQAIRIR